MAEEVPQCSRCGLPEAPGCCASMLAATRRKERPEITARPRHGLGGQVLPSRTLEELDRGWVGPGEEPGSLFDRRVGRPVMTLRQARRRRPPIA